MSKTIYTLGQEGVRKFKELTANKTSVNKRIAHSPQHGIDNYYPTPYQVQWAQSSGQKDVDGNYLGTYIIYLPQNCLRNGTLYIDSWNVTYAENYSKENWDTSENPFMKNKEGWFDLAPILKADSNQQLSEFPAEFDIWLDYSTDAGVFYLTNNNEQKASRRILIAKAKNKNIIQCVNSSITISDFNKPFSIIQWIENETPIYKIIDKVFYDNGQYQYINTDETIPLDKEGQFLIILVAKDTIYDDKTLTEYSIRYVEIEDGKVKEPPTDINRYKILYDVAIHSGGLLAVGLDYRDATVDLLDSAACDETSITRLGDVTDIEELSSKWWYNKLHLYGFHTISDSTAWSADSSFITRRGGKGIGAAPEGDEYIDYLNIQDFRNGMMQQVADALSVGELSGLFSVDNASISRGDDGQLSGVLHMNDFHNSNSNTTTMSHSSIVLRTPYSNPDLPQVANKLEYMPFDDYKDMMDDWIDTAVTEAIDQAISETGDITTTINEAIENALNGLSATGGGSSGGMFAWDEKTRTIGPGGCMIGRQWYTAQNTGSDKADGLYSVVVTLNSSGTIFCGVVSTAALGQAPTDTQCWIPIYQITDGKIAADYRGAFVVPAYD